jgi:hypothetical protein
MGTLKARKSKENLTVYGNPDNHYVTLTVPIGGLTVSIGTMSVSVVTITVSTGALTYYKNLTVSMQPRQSLCNYDSLYATMTVTMQL